GLMAGVDVGGDNSRRRSMNSDINMIPFIDLLFVTIAFLLITAACVHGARIGDGTNDTGRSCGPPGRGPMPYPSLHVSVAANEFNLVWRQGQTVLSETTIPRPAASGDDGGAARPQPPGRDPRYPELARAIEAEWARKGVHTDPADRHADQVVLHTD